MVPPPAVIPETRSVAQTWSRVPHVAAAFWAVKLLTTGMGEAASDYLAGVNLVLAAGVGLAGLVVALWFQLRSPRYSALRYWSTVAMVAVFGTMAADAVHVVLGVPYPVTTVLYAAALAAVFVVWSRVEGTLSIHSINTARREVFYWLAVLATFALGTAAGDLTAYTLHLGYLASAGLFAVAILVPLQARRVFGMNAVVCFWSAYVLTRPLGASIADWLSKPHTRAGGLGLGDGTVTSVALVAFVVLVGWLALTRSDDQARRSLVADGPRLVAGRDG